MREKAVELLVDYAINKIAKRTNGLDIFLDEYSIVDSEVDDDGALFVDVTVDYTQYLEDDDIEVQGEIYDWQNNKQGSYLGLSPFDWQVFIDGKVTDYDVVVTVALSFHAL